MKIKWLERVSAVLVLALFLLADGIMSRWGGFGFWVAAIGVAGLIKLLTVAAQERTSV